MPNQQIIDYAQAEMKKGITLAQIEETLLAVGWSKDILEASLKTLLPTDQIHQVITDDIDRVSVSDKKYVINSPEYTKKKSKFWLILVVILLFPIGLFIFIPAFRHPLVEIYLLKMLDKRYQISKDYLKDKDLTTNTEKGRDLIRVRDVSDLGYVLEKYSIINSINLSTVWQIQNCSEGHTKIGIGEGLIDLSGKIVPDSLSEIPFDPKTGTKEDTGYEICAEKDGVFWIYARDTEVLSELIKIGVIDYSRVLK